jgi:UV DNA damage endonuclease
MHPDQFTLVNSIDEEIFKRSRDELLYHARVLDAMGLDTTAKIQIHVGGVYGNKTESVKRFISRFKGLDGKIKRRLVIENDDVSYTLRECLAISEKTGIPVLFDAFHHSVHSSGETMRDAVRLSRKTWKKEDGILMVDYSLQKPKSNPGTHAESIDIRSFKDFITRTDPYNFDVMLEIKDKEKSALKAVKALQGDTRFKNTA